MRLHRCRPHVGAGEQPRYFSCTWVPALFLIFEIFRVLSRFKSRFFAHSILVICHCHTFFQNSCRGNGFFVIDDFNLASGRGYQLSHGTHVCESWYPRPDAKLKSSITKKPWPLHEFWKDGWQWHTNKILCAKNCDLNRLKTRNISKIRKSAGTHVQLK